MTTSKSILCTSDFPTCFPVPFDTPASLIWIKTDKKLSQAPSQADVAVFKALSSAPAEDKYPNAARWYKHIASYEDDFATLPGDATKAYTTYGPEVVTATLNPAKAEEKAGDDDDEDLFGSDSEDEDPEAAKAREERLAEYRKKKEGGKPKPAAKSIVTIDIKPWGAYFLNIVTDCNPANRSSNR